MEIRSCAPSLTRLGAVRAPHLRPSCAATLLKWRLLVSVCPLAILALASPVRAGVDNYGLLTGVNMDPGAAVEFSTLTNTTIGAVITGVGAFALTAVFSPDGRYAYVLQPTSNSITVLDVAARTIVGTIGVGSYPNGIAISPDGQHVYATSNFNDTVSVISTATNQVVGAPIAVGTSPYGVAVSPDGSRIYVANLAGSVSVIDAATRTVLATVSVGIGASGINVSPDGSKVYVANQNSRSVSVLATATNTLVATIPLSGNPVAVVLSPDGRRAYVTDQGHTLFVIDTATNSVVTTVTLPDRSWGVSVTPDGSRIYVSGAVSATVIDAATNTVVGTVSTTLSNNLSGGTSWIGPSVIVATGGAVSAGSDAALTTLGFDQYVNFNGGTLQLGGSFTTAKTISLLAQGGVIDTNGFNLRLDGTIINNGMLTKAGLGTLTLAGANSYTGGTLVTGGLINFNAANNFGTGLITLDGGGLQWATGTTTDISARLAAIGSNGGTFDTNGNTVTFATGLTGTGGLTKIGAGSLVLAAANAYTGATLINAGTLALSGAGSIAASSGVNVGTGATFDISATNVGATIATLAGSGGVALGSRTLTLANASSSFAGTLTGSGGLTLAAGRETLTGTSTYSGATTINGGTLSVNGSIANSATTIGSGGTLAGTGTVGHVTLASGGTLAPGNSIGTLSVNGNLSFNAASTYAVEVSPTASDRVNVTGTATLGGARVAASFEPGTYVAKQYTILNAAGGIVGAFGQKVDTNLPSGFKSALSYDPNNAYLDLTLDFTPTPPDPPAPVSPIPNRGLNRNQTAVANALTGYFNRNGGIAAIFGSLTPAGLSQVAGEPATGVQQTSADVMTRFMGALTANAPDRRGVPLAAAPTGFAAYSSARGQAEDLPTRKGAMAPAITPDPDLWRWSVWAAGYGAAQFNGADAGTGTAASTSRIYGAMAGADYRIAQDTVAGFALGGGATSFNTFGLGSGSSDLFQAGAFIRQQMGRSYVTASAAYAWQDVTTDRSVAGLDRLQGRFDVNSWSGRIEAGHRFAVATLGLTPYAAGQFTTVSLPGYRETALSGPGTFALAYAGKDTTRLRGELGLRADAQLMLAGKPLKLEAGAAWIRNGHTGSSAVATFQTLPGASFVVSGTALDRNALRTTASAELKLADGFTLAASLEGEFARNSRSLGGKTALRYQW